VNKFAVKRGEETGYNAREGREPGGVSGVGFHLACRIAGRTRRDDENWVSEKEPEVHQKILVVGKNEILGAHAKI